MRKRNVKLIKKEEVVIESLIKRNFTESFLKKIYDIYMDKLMAIVEKTIAYDKLFTEEFGGRKDYRRIGEGTNRFVCLLDNHIIKVAYNYLAYIDNMNELAMAKKMPKELALAYETNGVILVSEYVTVMDKEDFLESQSTISLILTKLQENRDLVNKEKGLYYILGDMGMSNKNYGNWGRRMNGEIVVLDYGYLYEMSYKKWKDVSKCPVCGSSLEYTNDYSELKCIGDSCKCKVKYTTLRNALGYENIINNIEDNLHHDKYVKFDKSGKIKVDVMEEVEIEEVEHDEFIMPEEHDNKFKYTAETFLNIMSHVKRNGIIGIESREALRVEIFNDKDLYVLELIPFILTIVMATSKNVDSYLKDFEKRYDEIYNLTYQNLKNDNDKNKINIEDYDIPDVIEEPEIYSNFNESNVKLIDTMSEDRRVVTSLDELLGSSIDDEFSNLIMVDENKDLFDKMDNTDDDYTLDEIMNLLEADLQDNNTKETDTEDNNDPSNLLEERFKDLKKSLQSLLEVVLNVSKDDDFTEGDVYRTYLNGDKIDTDYSPEVNAQNILGGWEPDVFAFPLYRHLLEMMDYDSEEVNYEYEARYRIGNEIEYPEDLYDKVENRSIVVNQIMSRFENPPSKSIVINSIGTELTKYYEALDLYYEENNSESVKVDVDDPSYYLEILKTDTSLMKEMEEARSNLADDLLDANIRLKDELKTQNIAYYYDVEYLYNETQNKIKNVIEYSRCLDGRDNIKENLEDLVKNNFFRDNRFVFQDSTIEPFKYGGSFILNCGTVLCPRSRKPELKAKLVPKDSTIDLYKPKLFTKEKCTRIIVEQRYEVVFKNTAEDETIMNDLVLDLNKRNLYYHRSNFEQYKFKSTKANLSYLLTEQEIELFMEYDNLYGFTNINDVDKLYANSVVEIILDGKNVSRETVKLFRDLAKYGVNEALAQRYLTINILEINGCMTRLDYLNKIKG